MNPDTVPESLITYTSVPPALQGPPSTLTLTQTAFLAAYVVEGAVRAAAREANITPETHLRWVRESEAYRLKFQAIAAVSLDEARARLDALLPQAAQVYEDGLIADKELAVTCPACEHEFFITVENFARRLTIAKDLFKRSGDLAAKVQVSGEVKHRDMALEDRLALAQVQSWELGGRAGQCPVPPDVYDDLNRRGLLAPVGSQSQQPTYLVAGAEPTNTSIDSAVRRLARDTLSGAPETSEDVLDGEFSDAVDA